MIDKIVIKLFKEKVKKVIDVYKSHSSLLKINSVDEGFNKELVGMNELINTGTLLLNQDPTPELFFVGFELIKIGAILLNVSNKSIFVLSKYEYSVNAPNYDESISYSKDDLVSFMGYVFKSNINQLAGKFNWDNWSIVLPDSVVWSKIYNIHNLTMGSADFNNQLTINQFNYTPKPSIDNNFGALLNNYNSIISCYNSLDNLIICLFNKSTKKAELIKILSKNQKVNLIDLSNTVVNSVFYYNKKIAFLLDNNRILIFDVNSESFSSYTTFDSIDIINNDSIIATINANKKILCLYKYNFELIKIIEFPNIQLNNFVGINSKNLLINTSDNKLININYSGSIPVFDSAENIDLNNYKQLPYDLSKLNYSNGSALIYPNNSKYFINNVEHIFFIENDYIISDFRLEENSVIYVKNNNLMISKSSDDLSLKLIDCEINDIPIGDDSDKALNTKFLSRVMVSDAGVYVRFHRGDTRTFNKLKAIIGDKIYHFIIIPNQLANNQVIGNWS